MIHFLRPAVLASWMALGVPAPSQASADVDDNPAALTAMGPIELREGVAISGVNRERRAAFAVDPVAAQVVAGTWAMPKAGDQVTIPQGQTRRWEIVKAGADGWFSGPAIGGGYLASTVDSGADRVMMLEASGHAMVYAASEPRAGDTYETGFMQLPVRLHKGPNVLLFQTGRDRLKARLTIPKGAAFFNSTDPTMPDLIAGKSAPVEGAIVVVNATEMWHDDLAIVARLAGSDGIRTPIPALVPMSARKVGFGLGGVIPPRTETATFELTLQQRGHAGGDSWTIIDSAAVSMRVRQPAQTHKRTFRSAIDGSVQYYAVVPALPATGEASAYRPGLVLTLHGAGVQAIGQAEAYAPKPGLHIIAPTNRRPYGFDWEDWGRIDAIEVLELAQRAFNTDPRRTYLTGHSMGGHGTWHLGVTYPDRFAAIAPSAGWISMQSYAGVRRTDAAPPVEQLVQRATAPSDTLALVHNLSSLGVYILHGDADDNVRVDQARQMRKVLGEFHPDFAYHEQPGAGHWWGSPCVDWPPLFAFIQSRTIPPPAEVRRIDFVTASPAVSHRAHWASIEAQLKSTVLSKIHLELDAEHQRIHGTTDNVARLALNVGQALPAANGDTPTVIELDGQSMPIGSSPANGDRRIWLARAGGSWSVMPAPAPPARKGPLRQGPFKEAFHNHMIFVIGTRGTAEENAWGLARARFDAETFWYRGNGSVDIVADTTFLEPGRADEFRDHNVILYGHSECNAAWSVLLGNSPVQVRRGLVQIGQRTVSGDNLACLFLQPRPGSDRAAVGAVTGTGLIGLRLTQRLPYFTSGVAYPDCLLLRAQSQPEKGSGLLAAGYFGADWDVDSGEFAWRD
jgi:predicted esterase